MASDYQSNFDVKRFLLLLIPLAVILGLVILFIYHQEYKNEKHLLEIRETQILDLQRSVINTKIKSIASDLLFLTSHHELWKYLKDGRAEDKEDLEHDLLELILWKGIYDQIRYLDETGMEIMRINYNNGDPTIVKTDGLQDKGKRYYFMDTAVLEKFEIFISPFDLNIEHGEIETPLKPMIRFGTPLIDKEGVNYGIALINYLGNDLLKSLKLIASKSKGRFMLLNSDGYWLLAPEAEKQWGFMFGNDKTFGREFPMEWKRISKEDHGQFYNSNGLFTFITIHPAEKGWKTSTGSPEPYESSQKRGNAKSYYWKAVLHVPVDDLKALAYNHLMSLTVLYVIMFSILVAGSWKLSVLTARRKQDEEILRSSYHDLEVMVGERTSEIERWAKVFENAEWGVVVGGSKDQELELMNPAYARMHGYTVDELTGSHASDLYSPEDRGKVSEFMSIARERGYHTFEAVRLRKDGSTFHSLSTISAIRDADGETMYYAVNVLDITERKRAEDKVRQQLEELQKWQDLMLGREDRVLELKEEVNELLSRLGEQARYQGWEEDQGS